MVGSASTDVPPTTSRMTTTAVRQIDSVLGTAALAAVANPPDEEGDVADGDAVIHIRPHHLPGIAEVVGVLPHSFVPAIDAALAELGEEGTPLDLGVGQRDERVEVTGRQEPEQMAAPFQGLI